ncbi:hypothetical protein ITP53_30495 [Nonomuraea sp. K274]|uniref:Solute-binding protein family 5 domain-containing protein n=1 Tax=Nonomuraea cypriaca TaxID=1187855 RepID=A0A931F101_9ACTN|nr:ABC transporter substrate-binding protein [Nonomuraea cypriaca]MBF8189980.1 hypothetical protein [Nonomuraea cypriaca]
MTGPQITRVSLKMISALVGLCLVTACVPDDATGGAGTRTLTWSTGAALGTLDVVADQVNGTARRLLLGSVVEGLTKVENDHDKLSWSPLLATSWKRVAPTRWRFELRRDVSFHDGSAMTADDVAYSINKLTSPSSAKDSTLANIAGAKVVDDYTVDVTTKLPDFYVFRTVAAIGVQPDGWGKDKAKAQNTAVGTGPYEVGEVTPAHDQTTLKIFPKYWGDAKPYYQNVVMKVIPDTGARLAGLQAGEADVAFDLSPDLLAAAPATISAASTETDILRISDASKALKDERVRQALNYAVDRSTLIKSVRFGFALPPKGQGVSQQVHGYNPGLQDYPYDMTKAAQLVREAGATGTKLTMMCVSEYYGTVGTDTCQTLASAYNKIGLDVKVQLLPREQWIEQGLLAPQNHIPPPDLFYVQAGSGTLDSTLYIQNYFTCGDVRATFCDEQLKKASEDAIDLKDESDQAKAYQKVHALAHDLAPIVWITSPKNAVATQSGIDGKLYSDAYTTYWYEWKGK